MRVVKKSKAKAKSTLPKKKATVIRKRRSTKVARPVQLPPAVQQSPIVKPQPSPLMERLVRQLSLLQYKLARLKFAQAEYDAHGSGHLDTEACAGGCLADRPEVERVLAQALNLAYASAWLELHRDE